MDIDRHLLFIFKNVFREFRGVNKSKLIYLFTIIKKKNTCETLLYVAVLGVSCGMPDLDLPRSMWDLVP